MPTMDKLPTCKYRKHVNRKNSIDKITKPNASALQFISHPCTFVSSHKRSKLFSVLNRNVQNTGIITTDF